MINKKDTAFNTGVEPTFAIRSYIVIVSGASDPTRNKVVLKFSNDTKNATMADAIIAGRRNGKVMVNNTLPQLAPRFNAASSIARSNFFNLAEITSVVIVDVKEICPKTTRTMPGRRNPKSML